VLQHGRSSGRSVIACCFGFLHCLVPALLQCLQQVHALFTLQLHASQRILQSPLGLCPRHITRGHAICIVIVDLVQCVAPRSQCFGLVVLHQFFRQQCESIYSQKHSQTNLSLKVNCRRAGQIALIVRLLHRGRRRLSKIHPSSTVQCKFISHITRAVTRKSFTEVAREWTTKVLPPTTQTPG